MKKWIRAVALGLVVMTLTGCCCRRPLLHSRCARPQRACRLAAPACCAPGPVVPYAEAFPGY